MSKTQILSADKLCFSFPSSPRNHALIQDASFRIVLSGESPSRIGLIGPNGHGKTTLLRLLLGEFTPDAGSLSFPSPRPSIAYLPQTILEDMRTTPLQEFVQTACSEIFALEEELLQLEAQMATASEDELTAILELYGERQDAFVALEGYDLRMRIARVMEALGLSDLPPERPLEQLSIGQQARAALARMLLTPAKLLILDEPTNHLDIEAQQWLAVHLREYQGALVVVSHERSFLDELVNEVWLLKYGEFEAFSGNYSEFEEYCLQRQERMQHEHFVQQKEIKRLRKSAQQRQNWSDQKERTKFGPGVMDRGYIGACAARHAKRAKHALQRIEQELEKREKALPLIDREVELEFPIDEPPPEMIVQLQGATIGRGERAFLTKFDWDIRGGDRWSVVGPNGSGKTTLLLSMTGELPLLRGYRKLHPRVKLHHFTQEHTDLWLNTLAKDICIMDAIEAPAHDSQARVLLAYLGFKKDAVFQPVLELSPGQRARVALARALLSGANLLILDEPTNHLDIPARLALERGLQAYQGTLICVSHDRTFLDAIGGKMIEL